MSEARYHRALAISLGLDPDTPPEDLRLVQRVVDADTGRMLGAEPAKSVVDEYQRCRRWVEEEDRKRHAAQDRQLPRG